MAKTVVIKRDGSNVTATPINSPKMRYYPTLEAAENAIANGEIGVGEVISIKEGNEADERDASLPVGTIVSYYSDNIPSGWLLCDGSEFDTAKYPLLYALLGKDTVPDLRGRAVMGVVDGGTLGELQDDATAKKGLRIGSSDGASNNLTASGGAHSHRVSIYENFNSDSFSHNGYCGAASRQQTITWSTTTDGSHQHNVYISSSDSETRPKNIRLNYIIKAVQGNINEVESAAITALAEQVTKATTFSEAGTFQISTGSTHTVAIPENFSEMLAVYGTPYYMETALVPKGILDINTTYNIDYESGISGGVSTQVVQLRINKSGAITVTTVKQNGSASTGFLTLYFR